MRILAYRLPEFQAQIERFNKKALRWNLPLVEYNVTSTEVEERMECEGQDESGRDIINKFKVEVCYLEVSGDIPRIAGWSIHSKVQPSDVRGQNFVFTAPGHESVESLRTCSMYCEHCKTSRRRNTVFMLEHKEEGKRVMVGSTCLQDFLPGKPIEQLMAYMDNFNALGNGCMDEEDSDRIPRSAYVYHRDDAILDAYTAIKKWGFISRAKADEMGYESTADNINPPRKLRQEMYDGVDIDAYNKELEGFIPHMMAKSNVGNDFIYNVQLALQQDWVKPKLYGYIAAAVNVWLRDLDDARKVAAGPELNEHFGEVGKRYNLNNLKVLRHHVSEGQFGLTHIYGFVDEKGRAYTWFGTRKIAEVDEVINIKGSIKGHDEYKGRKQTVLTRCTRV